MWWMQKHRKISGREGELGDLYPITNEFILEAGKRTWIPGKSRRINDQSVSFLWPTYRERIRREFIRLFLDISETMQY